MADPHAESVPYPAEEDPRAVAAPVAPRPAATMQFEELPPERPQRQEEPPQVLIKAEPLGGRRLPNNQFVPPEPVRGPGVPHGALVPEGMRFPQGKQIMFLRFKSHLTDAPWKGSPILDLNGNPITEHRRQLDGSTREEVILFRQCIIWPINVGEKRMALGRSMGDQERGYDEMTRQMIRSVDNVLVDWAVGGVIDEFWNDLGERCRGLMQRMYTKLHVLDAAETIDFLANCVEVRTSAS